jgi:hypothetical protein
MLLLCLHVHIKFVPKFLSNESYESGYFIRSAHELSILDSVPIQWVLPFNYLSAGILGIQVLPLDIVPVKHLLSQHIVLVFMLKQGILIH